MVVVGVKGGGGGCKGVVVVVVGVKGGGGGCKGVVVVVGVKGWW